MNARCAHTKQMNKQGDKVPGCASDGFEKRFLRVRRQFITHMRLNLWCFQVVGL
jgi:hypothetical protein